jgi:hypothetical protein
MPTPTIMVNEADLVAPVGGPGPNPIEQTILDRLDRLEQALVTFASAAGAPDQYRQLLLDLGITPPAPVASSGFQQAAKR